MTVFENPFKTIKNFNILGVEFNACNIGDIVNLICNLDVSQHSAHITFIGVPVVNLCQRSDDYKNLYEQTTVTSIDGQPIVSVAQKIGIKCERCSGPDVMEAILLRTIQTGEKHYFYGASQDTLDKLIDNLRKKFPEIEIAGSYSPPYRDLTDEENNEIVSRINQSGADYVWVGLGAPKQDVWINSHLSTIKNVKFMAVGAAFDFYAHTLKRAPKWIRKIGLEWLYRLLKEPRRLWSRYVVGGIEWIKNKKRFFKVVKNKRKKSYDKTFK